MEPEPKLRGTLTVPSGDGKPVVYPNPYVARRAAVKSLVACEFGSPEIFMKGGLAFPEAASPCLGPSQVSKLVRSRSRAMWTTASGVAGAGNIIPGSTQDLDVVVDAVRRSRHPPG